MRTAISVSVIVLMFTSLAFNSISIFDNTVEMSFLSTDNQEVVANKKSESSSIKKPKGTSYRGSGRIEFM